MERAHVHAVRRVRPPSELAVEAERTWYGVELTFTPGGEDGWRPDELAIVAPDETTRPAAERSNWVVLAAARVWEGGAWHDPAMRTLRGERRVRLLVGVWPGAPQRLKLGRRERWLEEVDFARADLPLLAGVGARAAEPEETWVPGECVKCGDMNLVDTQGLCGSCRGMPPCRNHADALSVARCLRCGKPFCADCLDGGRCEGCQGEAGPQPRRRGARPPAAEPADAEPGLRGRLALGQRQMLAGAVGVLVLVQVAMFAWSQYENMAPKLTPEQLYEERVGVVQSGIGAFRAERGKLPASPQELAAYMGKQGLTPPKIVGPKPPLPGDAVVYAPKGGDFELYATKADGEPYRPESEGRRARPRD